MDVAEILLVEDSTDELHLALNALRRSGQSAGVRVARNGVEALEALFGPRGEGSDFRPRLILLDLKLPGMDGFEVLQCIKSNPGTRLIPIVVLTSSGQEQDIEQAYRLGANGYIVKPLDFGSFIETVQILCNYWLTHNRAVYENPVRA